DVDRSAAIVEDPHVTTLMADVIPDVNLDGRETTALQRVLDPTVTIAPIPARGIAVATQRAITKMDTAQTDVSQDTIFQRTHSVLQRVMDPTVTNALKPARGIVVATKRAITRMDTAQTDVSQDTILLRTHSVLQSVPAILEIIVPRDVTVGTIAKHVTFWMDIVPQVVRKVGVVITAVLITTYSSLIALNRQIVGSSVRIFGRSDPAQQSQYLSVYIRNDTRADGNEILIGIINDTSSEIGELIHLKNRTFRYLVVEKSTTSVMAICEIKLYKA
ncbi:hypothetical protein DPMN_100474, partial [Dreissena polymorpha]